MVLFGVRYSLTGCGRVANSCASLFSKSININLSCDNLLIMIFYDDLSDHL